MRHPSLFAFLTVALLFPAFIAAAQSAKESDHNRKGLEYFDEAFYQQLPKGRQREADQYFDLALSEFKQAIAANPKSVAAHRHLARLYYVRKDFLNAADAYRTVTLLEPQDIDAHCLLALTYTQVDRFDEAIQVLETAKTKTDNPEIIGKLDGYIRKVRERN